MLPFIYKDGMWTVEQNELNMETIKNHFEFYRDDDFHKVYVYSHPEAIKQLKMKYIVEDRIEWLIMHQLKLSISTKLMQLAKATETIELNDNTIKFAFK